MITVMGATGRTGSRICQTLLEAGVAVCALGRNAERLASLAAAGARIAVGESHDAAFLTEDYREQQAAQGEAILTAIRDSGVRRVVFLSSVGAEVPSGTGPIISMHDHEQRLRQLPPEMDVLMLRSGALFENLYGALEIVRAYDCYSDAVAPDVPVPMVATRDVADAASRALLEHDWQGVVIREVLGQRDISYAQATRLLGAAIGRPDLPYVPVSPQELEGALRDAGCSASVAACYAELGEAISSGRVRAQEARSPANTTATPFEDFAQDWAKAYRALP
ncbi:NAD(P)H-binding protein [Pseudomonas nicosulfuronedens]|uniref:NmrA family NAD(P)-binding protein n=1 Tax=Pseudomonas nicosulfuronedens TaxID=2571105 RepID=UPI0024470C12|nr:NAD(P)H-binding protein [Pseudomonas nicosulfuronedens]MDH1007944.1 NAD(P)H-binding protein [Pseudomonas nicosulfuronedens]MDH1978354.1 NAD(P)H-binding protein [Pseudomonas nicosulfuronedens]MDH2025055.1 NAD(P)H-binding protein [Pseudomonas nicosulfuronedens]